MLSKPSGEITSRYENYPEQKKDISYGDGTIVASEELVSATSVGKYVVPTNDAMDAAWKGVSFDDSGWTPAGSRVGYQSGTAYGGLLAYWALDDSVANLVLGGPALTVAGATYDAAVPGTIGEGKSLRFARASTAVASAMIDVSETGYTASFWFRTTAPTTGLYSVHAGELGRSGHDRHVYLSNGNIGVRVYNGTALATTAANYADGAWHHVAHVYGTAISGQKVYVDGVLVLSGTKAQSDFTWQDRVTIGFSNDVAADSQYHDGEIDEIAIWNEPLGQAAIQSLAAGTSPLLVTGFGPHIGTDVRSAMQNVSSSLYLRLPFSVNRERPYTQASLTARYDDGFVAYIDGVEVARRNAPGSPTFNSSATFDRSAIDAAVQEVIDISSAIGLLGNGQHVLSVHALNDAPGSPEFLFGAELSAATYAQELAIYLDPPTPGQPNATGFSGYVADTVFAPKRGLYDAAQNVRISSATPGATIAYTFDGTNPSPTNGVQVAPVNGATPPSVTIPVSHTQAIRAIAFKLGTGLRATNVDSHTYIFPSQVVTQPNNPAGFNPQWSGRAADYGMDANVVNTTLPGYSVKDALQSLPTVSLTGKTSDFFDSPAGIYFNTTYRGTFAERKVSVEWINPDGSPGWHVQAGARIHGNSSRGHSFTPKHPIRLKFREEYGHGKFKQELFNEDGAEKFDELLLRGCSTDSFPVIDGSFSDGEQRWNNDHATYLRDQWMRDTLIALGSPNCRGRYCHLYINGLYWGLYNLSERPTAEFFSETFGGKDEEWDVIKDMQEVNDGEVLAWNAMMAIVNDYLLPYADRAEKLLGNNPDGTRNPDYEVLLHLPSFIDYMIAHIAAGAEDWPDHNFWAGRRRGPLSEGFRFVAWDQEIAIDSFTRKSGRGSGNPFETVGDPVNQSPVDRNGPAGIYDTLRRVPRFQKMFQERIHELLFNNGRLSPGANRARWSLRMAEIDKAIVAESARWGDAAREGARLRETHWLRAMDFMNAPRTGFWDAILPTQVQRFRNASIYPSMDQPVLSRNGGTVENGFTLYFGTDQFTAYYTLDGSDPMGTDGEPSASALPYMGGVYQTDVIPQNGLWRYLVTATAPAPAWKARDFDDSAWPEGQGQFGYGDADEVTVISDGGNPSARNLTTCFRNRFAIESIPLSAKLSLLRDDGAVVYLNGKEIVRSNMHPTKPIVWSSTASTNASGVDENSHYYEYVLHPSDFAMGENVIAVEVHQVSGTSDDLSFDARLEVVASVPNSGITLTDSALVKVRARSFASEWSGLNSAYFAVDSEPVGSSNVVISELHYHPADASTPDEIAVSENADDYEFLELLNIGDKPVDFTHATFAAGIEFHFPTGYRLAPGGRCVVAKNAAAFATRYGAAREIAGTFENGTGLSNSGETITLTGGSIETPVIAKSFAYDDDGQWPAAADGFGPSLVLLNPTTNPEHASGENWIASSAAGGNPGQAPMPATFAQWSATFRDGLQLTADDDGDGLTNAMEFVFVTNPLQRDTGVLPSARIVRDGAESHLALTFRHRAEGPGFTLAVEASDDLIVWRQNPAVILVSRIDHGDGTVTATWRCADPIAQTGRRSQFMRARVTVTP